MDSVAEGVSLSEFFSAESLFVWAIFCALHGAGICSVSKAKSVMRLNQNNFMIVSHLSCEKINLEIEQLLIINKSVDLTCVSN